MNNGLTIINDAEGVAGRVDVRDGAACIWTGSAEDFRALLKTKTSAKPAAAPFKVMMVDGGDWIITTPKADKIAPRKAFKEYHGRAASRSARVYIVPPSYGFTNGGLNSTKKRGEFEPVEVL